MLILRPIKESDTDNIIKWRNSPEVLDYFIDKEVLTREKHLNWLNEYVFKNKVIQYIISYNNQDCGTIFLKNFMEEEKVAEIGIFLYGSDVKGKGIGKECIKIMTKEAFEKFGFSRVFCRILEDNIPSNKAFKSCGYKEIKRNKGIIFYEFKQ